MRSRTHATLVSIGVVVAVGAVTAAVTVGVIAGIRHFNRPSTPSHVAPESDPAAATGGPTSEECVQIHERWTESTYETIMERLLDRAASDPQSTTTSGLDGEPTEPTRAFSDAEIELMDACRSATEDACGALNELVAAELAPTRDALAACRAACETYPAGACTPPCIWGLFGFGVMVVDDAPGGCTDSPVCDPASDWRLSHDRSFPLERPWDRPPAGWVPPTPECVPVCDIDRDGFATARDYAGDCAEVVAWLEHDCETQVAPYRALDRSLGETVSRSMAVCQDADLAGMASLPPTVW